MRTNSFRITVLVGLACWAAGTAVAQTATEPAPTESALPAAPTTIPEKLVAGQQALDAGDLNAADTWFRQVLDVQPSQPRALLGMGDVLRQAGPRSAMEAIEYYRQFLQVRGSQYIVLDGRANYGLGQVYLMAGHYRLAKAALDQAYKYAPRDPDTAMALAQACGGLKELERAATLAQKAVQLAPDRPKFFAILSEIYAAGGKLAEAQQTIEKGIGLLQNQLADDPTDSARLENLRAFLGRRLSVLMGIAEQRPEDARLWLEISRSTQQVTDVVRRMMLVDSLTSAQRAAEITPTDPMVRIHQAKTLYLLGMTDQAEQALQALVEAGKAIQSLTMVRGQLQTEPDDIGLARVKQFLEQAGGAAQP